MKPRVHPALTPGVVAWLRRLRDHGPQPRPRGPIGYRAMHAKLTEWDMKIAGVPATVEDAKRQLGEFWWEKVDRSHSERITGLGLEALRLSETETLEELK